MGGAQSAEDQDSHANKQLEKEKNNPDNKKLEGDDNFKVSN
jgi:hypothetical protein